MNTRYQLIVDGPYAAEVLARYRDLQPRSPLIPFVPILAGILFTSLALQSAAQGRGVQAIITVVIGILCLLFTFREFFGDLIQRRRMKRSKTPAISVNVEFTEDDIRLKKDEHDSRIKYPAVTSLRVFDDGLFLIIDPNVCYWLPDSAIVEGSPAAARTLLSTRVKDHQAAP